MRSSLPRTSSVGRSPTPSRRWPEAGVEHERLPADPRRLGSGVLEQLELRRRHLAAVDARRTRVRRRSTRWPRRGSGSSRRGSRRSRPRSDAGRAGRRAPSGRRCPGTRPPSRRRCTRRRRTRSPACRAIPAPAACGRRSRRGRGTSGSTRRAACGRTPVASGRSARGSRRGGRSSSSSPGNPSSSCSISSGGPSPPRSTVTGTSPTMIGWSVTAGPPCRPRSPHECSQLLPRQ